MRKIFLVLKLLIVCSFHSNASELLVEAESFMDKGGWQVDQQFMDIMGSPYLIAHGMGSPVSDAKTKVRFPKIGDYYVYVRTYNWTSPWYNGEGPGRFTLSVNNNKISEVLGGTGNEWMWQSVGKIRVNTLECELRLHDLTGFDGRCDAIYFTTEKDAPPPASGNFLNQFRYQLLNKTSISFQKEKYDLVVIGGGIAGMSAAMSAARLGCKVALVNDRPIWGGNNSSEIRVHLGGRLDAEPYKNIGNLQKEFAPLRRGNAQPSDYYEDDKKANWLESESNITLYPCYRAISVEKEGNRIKSVKIQHIENAEEINLVAPIFSDCTGDGTVGYLSGADYRMGRESREEFGEETAPAIADKMTMGSSVQWYTTDVGKSIKFPSFSYGITFDECNVEKVTMGEWTWETGMNKDQIRDFEQIRDYGLLVVYSNWSYLKNKLKENDEFKTRKLEWVAYIAGKRESRRLLGDYILKEDDIVKHVMHEDATASTTWSIDLHYPDPANSVHFPGNEFKSIAKHKNIYPYPIPYRCFYSRNIDNLFMAGRNISVTHVALGTVRVMRTTGMMGEVVGMAASLCKKYGVYPRGVYHHYLTDLKELMKQGVGDKSLPNNQNYNEPGRLTEKPLIR
ncbi:MAG: FAD-dependent oxidoreductase [Phocaeicola sp.]